MNKPLLLLPAILIISLFAMSANAQVYYFYGCEDNNIAGANFTYNNNMACSNTIAINGTYSLLLPPSALNTYLWNWTPPTNYNITYYVATDQAFSVNQGGACIEWGVEGSCYGAGGGTGIGWLNYGNVNVYRGLHNGEETAVSLGASPAKVRYEVQNTNVSIFINEQYVGSDDETALQRIDFINYDIFMSVYYDDICVFSGEESQCYGTPSPPPIPPNTDVLPGPVGYFGTSEYRGYELTINLNNTYVDISDFTVTRTDNPYTDPTRAWLFDATGTTALANASFVGEDATITYTLTQGTTYVIVVNNDGLGWDEAYNDSMTYPLDRTIANYTSQAFGYPTFGFRAGYGGSIASITYTLNNASCIANWTCSSFAACNPSNVSACLAVTDSNNCGDPFGGNLADYNQACVYVPPVIPDDNTSGLINAVTGIFVVALLLGLLGGIALKFNIGNPDTTRKVIGIAIGVCFLAILIALFTLF